MYYLEEHSFIQKSAEWLLYESPPAQVLKPFAMFIGMEMVLPCPELFEFHGRVWQSPGGIWLCCRWVLAWSREPWSEFPSGILFCSNGVCPPGPYKELPE